MFSGENIDIIEHRTVPQIALRAPRGSRIEPDGLDVVPEVRKVHYSTPVLATRLRDGDWVGHTGKRIRYIVNIGVGGSYPGPQMAYLALQPNSDRSLSFRFIANVDDAVSAAAVRDLDPAETLFVISSRTFTTLETMESAPACREWVRAHLGRDSGIARHSVAVSTNVKAARQYGIDSTNIFCF